MSRLHWFKISLLFILSLFFCIHISIANGATLDSITISPASPSTAPGQTQQFKVIGNYSDGSQQDITTSASYRLNNTVANIDTRGLVTPIVSGSGSVVIEVTYQGKRAYTTLAVVPIVIEPPAIASNAVNPVMPGSSAVNPR